MANQESVSYLNYLIRTYKQLTDIIAATKNRLQSLPGDHPVKFDRILHGEESEYGKEQGLETVKGRINRLIGKELPEFDVWERWLKDVPGIGNVIAAELIMLYYYRFTPVCKECMADLEKIDGTLWCPGCEKSVKGDGNLDHKLGYKDFATISKWWAYMGRDIKDGKMRKRTKGVTSNWSASGRKLGFTIGDSFNKQTPDHKYKAVLLEEKAKYERKQPDITKGHRHNMARNNAVKLFLSHFWTVCRTLDGKPVTKAYAQTIMGHTNWVEPFYFEG